MLQYKEKIFLNMIKLVNILLYKFYIKKIYKMISTISKNLIRRPFFSNTYKFGNFLDKTNFIKAKE